MQIAQIRVHNCSPFLVSDGGLVDVKQFSWYLKKLNKIVSYIPEWNNALRNNVPIFPNVKRM